MPNAVFCPTCQTRIKQGQRFCAKCGTAFSPELMAELMGRSARPMRWPVILAALLLVGGLIVGAVVNVLRDAPFANLQAQQPARATETPSIAMSEAGKGLPPVGAVLTAKTFSPSNYAQGKFNELINFEATLTNNTGKNIRAFTGILHFRDLFDRDIFAGTITYEDGLATGQTTVWAGNITYNQYIDSHVRLKDVALTDVTVLLETQQVIFADGTKQTYP